MPDPTEAPAELSSDEQFAARAIETTAAAGIYVELGSREVDDGRVRYYAATMDRADFDAQLAITNDIARIEWVRAGNDPERFIPFEVLPWGTFIRLPTYVEAATRKKALIGSMHAYHLEQPLGAI